MQNDKYSICTKDFPLRLIFWSVSLYDHCFLRCKVAENQKCTECPQIEIEHLKSQKCSMYTKYLPLRPKFWFVRSTTGRFRDIRSSTIRNAPNDSKLNLNT